MKQSFTRVDLKLLRDFLRFPPQVKITGARSDPDHAGKIILELEGSWLPDGDGELVAEYSWTNETIPRFQKWSTR